MSDSSFINDLVEQSPVVPFKIPSLPKKIFDRIQAEEKTGVKQNGIRQKNAQVNARKVVSIAINPITLWRYYGIPRSNAA